MEGSGGKEFRRLLKMGIIKRVGRENGGYRRHLKKNYKKDRR